MSNALLRRVFHRHVRHHAGADGQSRRALQFRRDRSQRPAWAARSAAITAYGHFNPSAGLTWKFLPEINAYASYAVSNRAPTPAELTCASAASPCSLANFFVGDPSLQQVVGHTVEAGLRGRFQPFGGATLKSDLAFFHTTLDNDILFVNSPIEGRAFFQNVGSTLRQGVDLNIQLKTARLLAWIGYSYTDAAFQTGFTESSENNPAADTDGNIQIQPGDRLPGIPTNQLKLGVDYKLTGRLDGRRHRDLRRRAISVWRRGQSDAANAALFCAQPAYELSGHKTSAAVRAARKRLRRDLLHLTGRFRRPPRSRSCRRRAPPIRAATAWPRRSPSPSASAPPFDERSLAVNPGCGWGRGRRRRPSRRRRVWDAGRRQTATAATAARPCAISPRWSRGARSSCAGRESPQVTTILTAFSSSAASRKRR